MDEVVRGRPGAATARDPFMHALQYGGHHAFGFGSLAVRLPSPARRLQADETRHPGRSPEWLSSRAGSSSPDSGERTTDPADRPTGRADMARPQVTGHSP